MGDFPKWQHVLPSLYNGTEDHIPTLKEAKALNRKINKVKYVDDFKNYGEFDYWATPEEFYTHGGDCEDYAIAKYDALLRLGQSDKDMFIVVAKNKKTKLMHTLLQVKLRGKQYLLDNTDNILHPLNYLKRFDVQYKINRVGWIR